MLAASAVQAGPDASVAVDEGLEHGEEAGEDGAGFEESRSVDARSDGLPAMGRGAAGRSPLPAMACAGG
jgi:hypothetical protein